MSDSVLPEIGLDKALFLGTTPAVVCINDNPPIFNAYTKPKDSGRVLEGAEVNGLPSEIETELYLLYM